MKKSLAVFSILSMLTLSGCVLGVSTAHPPQVGFYGHPSLVVIPGTYVYAMADIGEDIFFHTGWWWRLWDGRWYSSRYYDRGWSAYAGVPGFYREIHPGWRDFYRHRRWNGHPWDCERIPAPRVQHDWKRWQDNRYWEREKNWGVRGFRPEPYRRVGLAKVSRDDARFRQQDRKQAPRFEDRRRGTVQEPDRRQEYSRERGDSRLTQPLFGNRPADSHDSNTRDRDRYREHRKSRPAQQTLERAREENETAKTERDRPYRELREDRRNRPFNAEKRQEPGDMKRQKRENYEQRQQAPELTPLSGQRQREAREERRDRQNDERQRGRSPQERPWLFSGQPGDIQTR